MGLFPLMVWNVWAIIVIEHPHSGSDHVLAPSKQNLGISKNKSCSSVASTCINGGPQTHPYGVGV